MMLAPLVVKSRDCVICDNAFIPVGSTKTCNKINCVLKHMLNKEAKNEQANKGR